MNKIANPVDQTQLEIGKSFQIALTPVQAFEDSGFLIVGNLMISHATLPL